MKLSKHFIIQILGLIIVGSIWTATIYGIYRTAHRYGSDGGGVAILHEPEASSIQTRGTDNGLVKRASWQEASIDGAVSTFSYLMNGANLIYATACTNPILTYFDIIAPPAGMVRLLTCVWVGALVAVANWASYTLQAYGGQDATLFCSPHLYIKYTYIYVFLNNTYTDIILS